MSKSLTTRKCAGAPIESLSSHNKFRLCEFLGPCHFHYSAKCVLHIQLLICLYGNPDNFGANWGCRSISATFVGVIVVNIVTPVGGVAAIAVDNAHFGQDVRPRLWVRCHQAGQHHCGLGGKGKVVGGLLR